MIAQRLLTLSPDHEPGHMRVDVRQIDGGGRQWLWAPIF
jgi:hypothetical protein